MIKAVLIDNEKYFLTAFSKLLELNFPEIQIIGKATTISEGAELIINTSPHLVFLDIEMNNETGFDLFKHFDTINYDVIFVSAFDEWAIKAIKYSAFDFLLKPVTVNELKSTLEKWKQKKHTEETNNEAIQLLLENVQSKLYKKIAFNVSKGIRIVTIDQIVRCQADASYTYVFLTTNEKLTITKNLSEIEKLLPSTLFIRCHKSHLVNFNYIKEYTSMDGGSIVLYDGKKIEVSTRKKDSVINFIKQSVIR